MYACYSIKRNTRVCTGARRIRVSLFRKAQAVVYTVAYGIENRCFLALSLPPPRFCLSPPTLCVVYRTQFCTSFPAILLATNIRTIYTSDFEKFVILSTTTVRDHIFDSEVVVGGGGIDY